MSEVVFGEAIRRIRMEKGLTQEQLAEGICSPSSLSRIENGSQVPSRRTFRLLMERLGGPGFSYAYLLTEEEFYREFLTEEILEALEYRQMDRAHDLLWELDQVIVQDDVKMLQFYELSKLICYQMDGVIQKDYVAKCIEILRLGRPDWDVEESLREYENQLRMGRLKMDVRKKDWVEIWALNNLAVGFMWEDEYHKALEVFASIYRLMDDEGALKKHSWKTKAVVCNNIAICLMHLHRFADAREYLMKASISIQKEGGIVLAMQLLRTKMEVSKALGDEDSYEKEIAFFQIIQSMLPTNYGAFENQVKELLIL